MKVKTMKFTPWKLDNCLTNDELLLGYLFDVIKDDDPVEIRNAIDDVVRIYKNRVKKSKKKDTKEDIFRSLTFYTLQSLKPKVQAA